MNYKKMIFSIFLLTAVMYGNSDVEIREDRIKQLEEARFKKEEEISRLNARLYNESIAYQNYKQECFAYWNPSDGSDKKASFDDFFGNFYMAFQKGEDTKIFCENAPFVTIGCFEANWFMKRAVLQQIFVESLMFQIDQLAQEFIEINKELNKLK